MSTHVFLHESLPHANAPGGNSNGRVYVQPDTATPKDEPAKKGLLALVEHAAGSGIRTGYQTIAH
jgi:hypothetical protein